MKKSTVGILAGLAIAATGGLIIATKKGRQLSRVSMDDDQKKTKKDKKQNFGVIKINR